MLGFALSNLAYEPDSTYKSFTKTITKINNYRLKYIKREDP